jgi:hypothetical protein
MFQSFKRVGLLRGQSGAVVLAEPDSLRWLDQQKDHMHGCFQALLRCRANLKKVLHKCRVHIHQTLSPRRG